MKKVLIVDDELSISDFLVDIVRLMNYEPKVLTSGAKVLKMAKEWKPDLITLDIMMPSPDGIEVLTQLKNDPETASIPIFVVSVVADKSEFRDKLSKAQKVFSKPLDTKKFINDLKDACNP